MVCDSSAEPNNIGSTRSEEEHLSWLQIIEHKLESRLLLSSAVLRPQLLGQVLYSYRSLLVQTKATNDLTLI